jgi:hypothetical protein
MSDATRGSFFESQLDSYRNRLSNIKQEEALNWAKKIAQSEQPLEDLKQAVAEIGTPLALDFLREGIMHYAGVASAHIGNKLKSLDPRIQEIFKGRMDELARVRKMSPEERKKWIADEVKRRKDAALKAAKEKADAVRREAGDAATRAADQAKKAVRGGNDREEDQSGGGKKQISPANSGQDGATDEANARGAVGGDDRLEAARAGNEQPEGATQPLGEPKVGNPDLNAVDDAGIQDRINAFPATDDPEGEFRAIDKQINRKARANLNKEDRSQLSKKAPLLGNDEAVQAGNDVMKAKLNAKNSVVNDSIGRRQQNLLPAEGYNDAGAPTAPTRGAPRSVTQQVDTSAVDDQGVNDRIESLKGLGDDEAFQEAGRIRGSIESKLSSLNKGRKSATDKATPKFKTPQSVEDLQEELRARNSIANDALARQDQRKARVTKYNTSGEAEKIRGKKIQPTPTTVEDRADQLEEDQTEQPQNRELRGAPEPELNLTEPTLLDAFTGQPVVRSQKTTEEPEEFQGGDVEDPYPETQRVVARPPPEKPAWSQVGAIPPMGQGEPIRAVPERNPYSLVQASEAASRANLARLFPKPDDRPVDFTGAAARKIDPNYSRAAQGSDKPPSTRTRPAVSDALSAAQQEAADNAPKVDVRARAQEFNSKFQIIPSKPQTGRLGQGDVPVLRAPVSAEAAIKSVVAPTRPKVNNTTPEVESEPRSSAPLISEETGGRIGAGLGALGQVAQIGSIAAGQGTAQQKASAIGEATGLSAASEIAQRTAQRLGASGALAEGAGLLPGAIATLAGPGTAKQKAQSLGTQAAQVGGQKVVQKLVGKGSTGAAEEEGSTAATTAATTGAEEGGLEGLEAGLLASGGETGGLGFLAAGAVGLIGALASIFSPHHDPDPKKAPPQPVPTLSKPVFQLGLS